MNLKDKILEQQDILENYKYFLDKLELKDNDKTFELYLKELMIIYVEIGTSNKITKFNSFNLIEPEFESKTILLCKGNLTRITKSMKEFVGNEDFLVLNSNGFTSSIFKSLMILLKEKLK